MTAPADLGASKRVGVRVEVRVIWSGLALGWSESTCKVEIGDTHPAKSFVQDAAAHSACPSAPSILR